ncbi:MAG: DNA polymerase III subunit alpha [Erysipelotrichaceae bacterium]|nr:DNA polymerase III subunit alpha [Erysipelotrichaceae bacterium]
MSVHLHVRSCYTLLNSTLRIKDIVTLAKQNHFSAVALCDRRVMHGAMAFHHECEEQGIHGIYGMECDCTHEEDMLTFILLAKDDHGYLDLLQLSTRYNTDKQPLSLAELQRYSTHCVVLNAGDDSVLEGALIREDQAEITRLLTLFQQTFDHFVCAIACNDSGLLKIKNLILKQCAKALSIPTCALSRIYYGTKEDEESYQMLCAIDQGLAFNDKTLHYSPRRYFRSEEEMAQLYDAQDLAQSEIIAEQCQVRFAFPHASLPQFQNKLGIPSDEYLRALCYKGLQKRMQFQAIPKQYKQRLDYELQVIISMGYADYFLIVYDFIRFARTQAIYVGPGRGSAAGSLVAYCLGITHVDPIHYHLLFERFLNPERISLPDIDTDFPDNRRDEVIAYVRERYGDAHVAHIITFNTLGAKQVLRDLGKVLRLNPRDVDALCKQVPFLPKVTLNYAYEKNPKFKQMVNASATMRQLYAAALKLEGLPRHASLHAAGIVFAKEEITSVCPLIEVDEGMYATQFTMEYLEELGLIKMDFLGLRNLTIIDEIVQMIAQDHTQAPDMLKLPLDDPKVYDLLCDVDTIGIFQLESEGIKQLIRQLQPREFEDIVAIVALYRPGPMENIPEYLKRRQRPEQADMIHPSLKPILQHTYGIMIYQEQIMQVAQTMADFSLAKADNLRKAISKKHSNELKQLEQEFVDGALRRGYEKDLAKRVYGLIMKFANYGFNRSHSVAYALVAYQMAYLKANWPLYFFCSLLNSVIGSESKSSEYIFEAKKRGIQVLLPSVNHSEHRYVIEGNALRFPLTGIKNIGSAVCATLVAERKAKGEYQDYFDFIARMVSKKINKKTVETLIYAGALDDFKLNRATLIASLDDAYQYGDLVKIEDENQIMIDFDLVSRPALRQRSEQGALRAAKEREVIGFYLSKHPIQTLRDAYTPPLPPLISLANHRGFVTFLCVLERTREHRTKNHEQMLFGSASDDSGRLDLVIFPKVYTQYRDLLIKGNYLRIEGTKKEAHSCIVNRIEQIHLPKE